MGRNKLILCQVCMKHFRSDYINVHRERHERSTKYPKKSCSICHKSMIAWHLPRHEKVHTGSVKQILENVRFDQNEYDKMERTGQMLKNALENEDIDPDSLRKEYVRALEINNKNMYNQFDSLKSWQEELLKILKPSQRDIIWITGKKGAEGKSWFQEYIEHYYGSKRVFRSSIDKKAESVFHALSKKTLPLIDVFVFNIPRCFDTILAPYSVFEGINDGRAISTKYDSKVLNFNTPNIVIVFSNDIPYTNKMSKDRWKTYKISKDELVKNNMFLSVDSE